MAFGVDTSRQENRFIDSSKPIILSPWDYLLLWRCWLYYRRGLVEPIK